MPIRRECDLTQTGAAVLETMAHPQGEIDLVPSVAQTVAALRAAAPCDGAAARRLALLHAVIGVLALTLATRGRVDGVIDARICIDMAVVDGRLRIEGLDFEDDDDPDGPRPGAAATARALLAATADVDARSRWRIAEASVVVAVRDGLLLLTAGAFGPGRLWDVRTARPRRLHVGGVGGAAWRGAFGALGGGAWRARTRRRPIIVLDAAGGLVPHDGGRRRDGDRLAFAGALADAPWVDPAADRTRPPATVGGAHQAARCDGDHDQAARIGGLDALPPWAATARAPIGLGATGRMAMGRMATLSAARRTTTLDVGAATTTPWSAGAGAPSQALRRVLRGGAGDLIRIPAKPDDVAPPVDAAVWVALGARMRPAGSDTATR